MFMKKRRHAEIMAVLHGPNIIGAPPTPPQSESTDNNSDLESDSDNDTTNKHMEEDEKPSKYAKITNSLCSGDSDSTLAKVLLARSIMKIMIFLAVAHRFSQLQP